MPPLKVLRNIVDRMKNLSNFVSLMANCSGDMKLKVETELVTVSAHFRDLGHPQWSKQTKAVKQFCLLIICDLTYGAIHL